MEDESTSIVDVLDAATRRSLRQRDGSFLIEVERGQVATVLSVIGRRNGGTAPPLHNAWALRGSDDARHARAVQVRAGLVPGCR